MAGVLAEVVGNAPLRRRRRLRPGEAMNEQRRGGFVMVMVVTMIGTYQVKHR